MWLRSDHILYVRCTCSPTEQPAGMIDLKVVKDITPYEKGGTCQPFYSNLRSLIVC